MAVIADDGHYGLLLRSFSPIVGIVAIFVHYVYCGRNRNYVHYGGHYGHNRDDGQHRSLWPISGVIVIIVHILASDCHHTAMVKRITTHYRSIMSTMPILAIMAIMAILDIIGITDQSLPLSSIMGSFANNRNYGQ